MLNKKLILSVLLTVFIYITNTDAAKTVVVNKSGGAGVYTSLSAAIASVKDLNDTTIIYIQGSGQHFNDTFPININNRNITFMGTDTNPDNFPVITLREGGWDHFWLNGSGTTKFIRVVLSNCSPIKDNNNKHSCIIENSIIYNYTSNSVFEVKGYFANFLTITNTIFMGNGTIFTDITNHNNPGPYGTVTNCTFFGNSTVNADVGTITTDKGMIEISNSIFLNNTTITDNAALKTAYTHNIIPTGQSGWHSSNIESNNPGFISTTPAIASDFQLKKTSPARDKASASGATIKDIAGRLREGVRDIGAWEWIDTNVPPTDINLSNVTINENNTAKSFIGKFTTEDENAGDTHTYTLVSGDISAFSISKDSLYSKISFNYELDSVYTIRVRSSDREGLTIERNFTIKIKDVNEAITDVTLSNSTISENRNAKTFIGKLSATDYDLYDKHSFSLFSGDTSHYLISNDSLCSKVSFNYESDSLDTITVRCSDGRGLFLNKVFIIKVRNVNEAPTNLILSKETIAENSSIKSVVGTFSTVDQDKGDLFTYSFVDSSENHNDLFTISGDKLFTATPIDYETLNKFYIYVKTSDGQYSFIKKFTIKATNINDPPTLITLSDSTIHNNEPVKTVIGTFSTVDQDTGDSFRYELVTTGDYRYFKIKGDTLITDSVLTFLKKSVYSITVRVTDDSSATHNESFTIRVQSKPIITTQPLNVTAGEGKNATFTIQATGTTPIKYYWYQQASTPVLIDSTQNLVIKNLTISQNQTIYYCNPANMYGDTQSITCTLTVLRKPSITSILPENKTITENESCTLSVVVSGDSLSYLWVKNGTDTLEQTSPQLIIDSAQGADSGSYRCIVSNIAGSVESDVSILRVLIPPKFSDVPDSVTFFDGDTARIGFMLKGTTPFTYKWIKNGSEVIDSVPELVLNGVTLSDNGTFYYCRVENIAAKDSTDTIYLVVKPAPPKIDSQPKNDTIIENTDAYFKVVAHGTPELHYAWKTPGSNSVFSDSNVLVFKDVKVSMNNIRFYCEISNSAGMTVSDTVLLIVNPEYPVVSNVNPKQIKTNVKKSARFFVTATGTDTLKFAWYKTGKDSILSTLDTLIFSAVTPADDGEYFCVVTNAAGSDTSDTARLIVDDELKAPTIIAHPKSQTKYIGESITFSVSVEGYPPPKYQWYLNGSILQDDTLNTLVLPDLKYSNNNDSVFCKVFNSEDTAFSNPAIITVTPAPVADFIASPLGGKKPLNVTFTNKSSGIYTTSIWDFGDGITSTEESPEHTYTKDSLYTVRLIVSGIAGSDTLIQTNLIYVYNEGDNPVQITAKYLRQADVEITLTGLNRIEPQIFPPVYDSIGIWVSDESLPTSPGSSTLLKTYPKSVFSNSNTYKDTLTLPQSGITWYLINGLYLTNKTISTFKSGNGTEVLLKDTAAPENVLSISGRHLGKDSALISIGYISPIDTEAVDSVIYCYALDSLNLDFEGKLSRRFSVKEFEKSASVSKIIRNDIFSKGSNLIWCAVKLKGKNGKLSVAKIAKFITSNTTVDNPLRLSAEALSSSAIRLSWDKIDDEKISKIRIWYGNKEVPLGSSIPREFRSLEISSDKTSFEIDLLDYSTTYYFGAQVSKADAWSDVVEGSRASAKTEDPSDELDIPNKITFDSPIFDTTNAAIKLSWCVDTLGLGDKLEVGITYSTSDFNRNSTDNIQILRLSNVCDSATLRLTQIQFKATYYISMWIRKIGGKWASPTDESEQSITTPDFIREPVSFFDPSLLFDTVKAFNGTVLLFKDENYGTSEVESTVVIFNEGKNYPGMISAGNGFYFEKKPVSPAFWIGLRYTVPQKIKPSQVGLYRETSKGLLVEHEFVNDTSARIISVRTKNFENSFIALIDTSKPVFEFISKKDKIAYPGKSTVDTITISDNILNVRCQYAYSTGKDPVTVFVDSMLSGTSQKFIFTIPKSFSSEETGIRAELRLSDGVNRVVYNASKQVYIEEVSVRIPPMQWVPLSVSAELNSTGPDSLIKYLSVVDTEVVYDNRYARVFYWYPTSNNKNADDKWVEYSDSTSSIFNFMPGVTSWVKTRNEKIINLGPGLTMSLKDTVEIKLPAKEFTDLTLPYNFAIRINDILDASCVDSINIYKWENDSGQFFTKGFYIPGKANSENRNDSIDWRYRNAYYTLYNNYKNDVVLKVPPVPVAMSSSKPLQKTGVREAWGVTVNCKSGNSHSEIYCGFAGGAPVITYPVSPAFSSSRVKIYDRVRNRYYGDYISGKLSDGSLSQEIVFENKGPTPVEFSFDLINNGKLPSGLNSAILNSQSKEWESKGTITVAANSSEYRWLAIGDNNYMQRFKTSMLSYKYALNKAYSTALRHGAVFKFTVPGGANEKLRFIIYDAMGRKVWDKVITNPLSVGEHTLSWNGQNSSGAKVSTGMYFVKLYVLDSGNNISKSFGTRLMYVH